MPVITFDALAYFEELKKAGVPEQQASIQANGMKAQAEAVQQAFNDYDEELKKDISSKDYATKADIALVRKEISETELRLLKELATMRKENKETELRLLKWQIGIGLAIAVPILTALGKGFNWFGF